MKAPSPTQASERIERGVLAVREGPSANCSSIGSVVDTLFVAATVGGALFVAVAAAVERERGAVRIIGAATPAAPREKTSPEKDAHDKEDPDAPPP